MQRVKAVYRELDLEGVFRRVWAQSHGASSAPPWKPRPVLWGLAVCRVLIGLAQAAADC